MGKRRERRYREQPGGFWVQEVGGAPYWLIASVTAAALVIGVWALVEFKPAPASADREMRPIPTFTYAAEAAAPVVIEFPRQADGAIGAVFLGDSLTYGLFASSEEAGYRPQVVSALSGVAAVNATRGGQTGNTVQTVSESATIPADTGLVVLVLGTNDVWNTPQADFAAQYAALADKVEASAPNAMVVCLGVWSNADGVRNYDPAVQENCERIGGTYIKIGDLFDAEGNRGPAGVESFGGISDDFHPNDTGYAAIAQRVKDALQLS